jgi:hypothetical protein
MRAHSSADRPARKTTRGTISLETVAPKDLLSVQFCAVSIGWR